MTFARVNAIDTTRICAISLIVIEDEGSEPGGQTLRAAQRLLRDREAVVRAHGWQVSVLGHVEEAADASFESRAWILASPVILSLHKETCLLHDMVPAGLRPREGPPAFQPGRDARPRARDSAEDGLGQFAWKA